MFVRWKMEGVKECLRDGRVDRCRLIKNSDVCLYQPTGKAAASVKTTPAVFHHRRSEGGNVENAPIGVAGLNEGGHLASLLVPHESILSIHSLSHSSAFRRHRFEHYLSPVYQPCRSMHFAASSVFRLF